MYSKVTNLMIRFSSHSFIILNILQSQSSQLKGKTCSGKDLQLVVPLGEGVTMLILLAIKFLLNMKNNELILFCCVVDYETQILLPTISFTNCLAPMMVQQSTSLVTQTKT